MSATTIAAPDLVEFIGAFGFGLGCGGAVAAHARKDTLSMIEQLRAGGREEDARLVAECVRRVEDYVAKVRMMQVKPAGLPC